MTTPDLSKVSRNTDSALAAALSNLDRESICKDINAGRWSAASREAIVRSANISLKGSGLAITLPMCDFVPYGEHQIKYTVSGWLLHEKGERLHAHASVRWPNNPKQSGLEQQDDGGAYTYAAKNCIINALMLPRGGNEQSELAHMEDYNGKDARRPTTGHQPRRPQKA